MTIAIYIFGLCVMYFLSALNVLALVYTLIGTIDPGKEIKKAKAYAIVAAIGWPVVGFILLWYGLRIRKKNENFTNVKHDLS